MSVIEANSVNRAYTYRPSFQPIKDFHGHFINAFSRLPKDGKLFEVIKRIGIVCVAPFAYLALLLFAVFGALISRVKFEKSSQSSGGVSLSPGSASENLDRLISQCNQELLTSARQIVANHQISKMKVVVLCTYGSESRKYETDFFSDERVTVETFEQTMSGLHQRMKGWILSLTTDELGLLGAGVTGHAFGLEQQQVYHAQWTARISSSDTQYSVSGSHSSGEPDANDLFNYLSSCINRFGGVLPESDQLPNSLFETRVLPDASYVQANCNVNQEELEF